MGTHPRSLIGITLIAAIGSAMLAGVAPRAQHPRAALVAPPGAARPVSAAPSTAPQADTPIAWITASGALAPAADTIASITAAVLEPVLGQSIPLDTPDQSPSLAWRHPELGGDNESTLHLGLDLNALRARHPDRFDDQRLNQALRALNLANARGVVLTLSAPGSPDGSLAGPISATLTVSYRDWDADASHEMALSISHPAAGAGTLALRPRYGVWVDSLIAAHRALLDPLDISPFDARLEAWKRRNEQKVRQVIASMDGPVIMGSVGGEPYALLGIGARADVGMTLRNLATSLEALGTSTFDPRAGVGHIAVDDLRETPLAALEWRLYRGPDRNWVLVTRDGAGETVAAELD